MRHRREQRKLADVCMGCYSGGEWFMSGGVNVRAQNQQLEALTIQSIRNVQSLCKVNYIVDLTSLTSHMHCVAYGNYFAKYAQLRV